METEVEQITSLIESTIIKEPEVDEKIITIKWKEFNDLYYKKQGRSLLPNFIEELVESSSISLSKLLNYVKTSQGSYKLEYLCLGLTPEQFQFVRPVILKESPSIYSKSFLSILFNTLVKEELIPALDNLVTWKYIPDKTWLNIIRSFKGDDGVLSKLYLELDQKNDLLRKEIIKNTTNPAIALSSKNPDLRHIAKQQLGFDVGRMTNYRNRIKKSLREMLESIDPKGKWGRERFTFSNSSYYRETLYFTWSDDLDDKTKLYFSFSGKYLTLARTTNYPFQIVQKSSSYYSEEICAINKEEYQKLITWIQTEFKEKIKAYILANFNIKGI